MVSDGRSLAFVGRALESGDALAESKEFWVKNRMVGGREKLEELGFPKHATGSPSVSTARLCDTGQVS